MTTPIATTSVDATQQQYDQAFDLNETLRKHNKVAEPQNVQSTTKADNYSELLYPTLIIVPLIIVLITVLTLKISAISKIMLLLLMIMVITVYILQIKKFNIVETFSKLNMSSKKKERLDSSLRFDAEPNNNNNNNNNL